MHARAGDCQQGAWLQPAELKQVPRVRIPMRSLEYATSVWVMSPCQGGGRLCRVQSSKPVQHTTHTRTHSGQLSKTETGTCDRRTLRWTVKVLLITHNVAAELVSQRRARIVQFFATAPKEMAPLRLLSLLRLGAGRTLLPFLITRIGG